MLPLLLAALTSAAPVESVPIPGSTVYFDLVELAPQGIRSFRIGRTEVTWAEYNLFADSGQDEKIDGITRPSQPDVVNPRDPFPDGTVQTGRYPARSIGMYGALGYCAWLSLKTGRHFRLPTESEWTAAAGRTVPAASAWHAGNADGRTHPVGSLPTNGNGLADVTGNVAELCLEPFDDRHPDGVVRGGSWRTAAKQSSPAMREKIDMDAWLEDDPKRPVRDWWFTDAPFVGFRVVEDGASEERSGAISRTSIGDLKIADPGTAPRWLARVTGTLKYAGDQPLDEVELDGCFADPDGKPIRTDPRGKPAYGMAWPVLASTAHRDGREKPLRPGESRKFSITVPRPFDEVGAVPVGSPVVKVTWVRFAR